MNPGLVVMTHGNTGEALLEVAEFIIGQKLKDIVTLSFEQSGEDCTTESEVRAALDSVDRGAGVLVLTDLPGASPCNAVSRVIVERNKQGRQALVVTGINLAMLMRAWNYRAESLGTLASKAAEGGRKGIEVMGT